MFYDEYSSQRNGLQTVKDTWWQQVIDYFQGILGVNNSYSGSRVSGKSFPSANQAARLAFFDDESGICPDYILLYIGFNDFGSGVRIKPNGFHLYQSVEYFDRAYNELLRLMCKRFTKSLIICGTLLKTYIKDKPEWSFPDYYNGHTAFDRYNNVICDACRKKAVYIADLADLGIRYETLDGTHPTVNGHKEIADAWIASLDKLGVI